MSVCSSRAATAAQRVALALPHHAACGTIPSVPSRVAPARLEHERSSSSSSCRGVVVARAVKRQLERDFAFGEVYESVVEKLRERKYLSVRETYQLIECIKSPEQAARCLDLIAGFIAARSASIAQGEFADPAAELAMAGPAAPGVDPQAAAQASIAEADQAAFQADWPHRKRFLARISEIAVLELQRPELVYAIINNWQRFRLSTYFGKDLILQLGANGSVPLEVLGQVAKAVAKQRPAGDKGVRGAMQALLQVHQDRGSSPETVAAVKRELAALKPAPAVAASAAAAGLPQVGAAAVRAPLQQQSAAAVAAAR